MLHVTTRQLSTQDPVDGATSIGPLSRSSGMCLLMEKVGPGGALRRRARTKLPSSCPVFWATRTMRWSHVSWRADKMRQTIKDPARAVLNEGVGGTRSPNATAEGAIDANLATKQRLQTDKWNRQFQGGPFIAICYYFRYKDLFLILREAFSHLYFIPEKRKKILHLICKDSPNAFIWPKLNTAGCFQTCALGRCIL